MFSVRLGASETIRVIFAGIVTVRPRSSVTWRVENWALPELAFWTFALHADKKAVARAKTINILFGFLIIFPISNKKRLVFRVEIDQKNKAF